MIRSMTGFGASQTEGAGVRVDVEAKSTNGRFLKLSWRLPPALSAYEQELEALARSRLRRGSLMVKVELRANNPESAVKVDEAVVRAYQTIFRRLGISEEPLATLPGVLAGNRDELSDDAVAVVRAAVGDALKDLAAMRTREGEALALALGGLCDNIETLVKSLQARAPVVVREYHDKLTARLATLLESCSNNPLDSQVVAREVAVFADRCDINEELDRLGSHVAQVRELINANDEAGRALEFLSQEILREVNTIGAKSADLDLCRAVVKLKTEIERFKEQIANVE